MKALSGLQYLLNNGFMVNGSSPKLSLAGAYFFMSSLDILVQLVWCIHYDNSIFRHIDQLDPIMRLAMSWQKMELEAMPLLLDELQEQYETNSAKVASGFMFFV